MTNGIISVLPLSTFHICSNIPPSPAYWVYISQLIRYPRTCYTYDQFLSQSRLLADILFVHALKWPVWRFFFSSRWTEEKTVLRERCDA
jgi:hypothetical protein